MTSKDQLALTQELFQLMKQFPRPKLKQSSIDGLTRSEYELLVMLVMSTKDGKGAFTVTEISSLLQVTPAGVTHLINPLEEAGYIERLPDPNDRRNRPYRAYRQGNPDCGDSISEVQENLIGLVNHLGEEDSKTLIRLLSKSIAFFASQFRN